MQIKLCICALEWPQGQCGSFGFVRLSLSLTAPTGYWQTLEKPFTVQTNSEAAKAGPMSWELGLKQAAHKNEQERLFQCLRTAGGLFSNCPAVTHKHNMH